MDVLKKGNNGSAEGNGNADEDGDTGSSSISDDDKNYALARSN